MRPRHNRYRMWRMPAMLAVTTHRANAVIWGTRYIAAFDHSRFVGHDRPFYFCATTANTSLTNCSHSATRSESVSSPFDTDSGVQLQHTTTLHTKNKHASFFICLTLFSFPMRFFSCSVL